MMIKYIGSHGSQGNQTSPKWLDLHVLHVLAPMVHWLPTTTKMSDYTLHQYILSHRVHWGPLAPLGLGWGLGLTINLTYDPSRPLWLHSQVSHNSSLLAPDHCLHWSHDSMRLPHFPCILCRADQCKPSTLGPLHILQSPCSCLTPLPPFT